MAIIPYDRITNLQNDQALAPTDPYPAQKLDQEYNAIKITTDDLIQHLDLIQRDDGSLENDSVGRDQLKDDVYIGFGAPAPWETPHDYIIADTVFQDNAFWYCEVSHTSTTFPADLALGYWSIIADFTSAATVGATMYVGDVPPAVPTQGQQWFESDTGNTYVFYNDGSSTQWIHTNGAVAGAAGGGGFVPLFDTRALVIAATIPVEINTIQLSGYATAGDGGAAHYKRVGSAPAHAGKVQSADGAWWELAEKFVNPMMFGGLPDGTDAAPGINAALVFSKVVYLPPGTFVTGSTINFTDMNVNFLIGAGSDATVIKANFNTGPVINVSGVSYPHIDRWGIVGVTVDRSVAPAGSGDGIYAVAHCNRAIIEDVRAIHQQIGINLGTCVYALVSKVICKFNTNHGLRMCNEPTTLALQWELDDVLCEANGGNGFVVQTVLSSVGPAAPLGRWSKIYTYGNNQYGLYIVADAACPIHNIRMEGAFIGSDGLGGIYLDSKAGATGSHSLSNLTMETTGRGGPTGPGLETGSGTPQTNAGNAITIAAGNALVAISDFHINGASDQGIVSDAGKLILSNGSVINCGAALTAGKRNGINIVSGAAIITDVMAFNTTGGVWQQIGLALGAATDGCLIDNCDLSHQAANSLQNFINSSTGLNNEVRSLKGNNYRAIAGVAVGASPFAYRVGPSAETLFLTAGTITGLNVNGAAIFVATNTSISLPPNALFTITYTAPPNLIKLVH